MSDQEKVKEFKTKVFGFYIFFKQGGTDLTRVISEDETTAKEVYAQIIHGKSWNEIKSNHDFNKIGQYRKKGNLIEKL